MSSALERLKNLTNKISSYELARKNNLKILEELYLEVGVDQKVPKFKNIFIDGVWGRDIAILQK